MEDLILDLDDSSTHLSCTFIKAEPGAPLRTLIIFLNGIDSPQTDWYPIIRLIAQQHAFRNSPPILMYDRVGQGDSICSSKRDRDVMSAVMDLRGLIEKIAELKLGVKRDEVNTLRTMIVGSSVGCSIARLYAQTFPRTIGGLLLLDPIPTNRDIMSLFPNTRSPGFPNTPLPSPITPALIDQAKDIIRKSLCDNSEHLWTRNVCDYLPFSSLPKLQGPKPNTPLVTVLVHDPEVFALQLKEKYGLEDIMTTTYMVPFWQEYSQGLMGITPAHLGRGPIIAKGCGHLIHVDNPQLVLDELVLKLNKVRQSTFAFNRSSNTPP